MKSFDVDRHRSETKLSLPEFLTFYNEGLPSQFPRVSTALLQRFVQTHPESFKYSNDWSLDQHRKKVMDWLPGYLRANPQGS